MTICAKPHLNGNDAKDFATSSALVSNAAEEMEKALRYVVGNPFHGRNYQSRHSPHLSRAHDMEIAQALFRSVSKMRDLARDLAIASMED
tara:strand:+ start:175 stop:444 length:270 start_codon:yes stop_codon:yes gene_type:complete